MMTRFTLYFFLFGFVLLSFNTDQNRIFWSSERSLNWQDYQGSPDFEDKFRDAVTASAINFKTRCYPDGKLDVFISAQFLKDQSWVKPEAFTTYHLGHEQLHFDITELYVRKFRQAIKDMEFVCEDQDRLQEIANSIMADCVRAQQQYDKETRYSLHKRNQANWEEEINNELKLLADLELNYSSTK